MSAEDFGAFVEGLDKQEKNPDNKGDSKDKDSPDNKAKASGDNRTDTTFELQQELERVKKQYGDSSREAKALRRELDEFETYKPLIKSMQADPQLINHVENYFTGGGQPDAGITQQLGLDEDFQFDSNDAFNEPNSDSAKVFNASVERVARQLVTRQQQEQDKKQTLRDQEREFRNKYEIADEDYKELVEWAGSRNITLEDIYFLKLREQGEFDVDKKRKKETMAQRKLVQGLPKTAAHVGGDSDNDDDEPRDKKLFDAIKNSYGQSSSFLPQQ